jgi:predicted Ser/Thr protein kinase
MKTLATCARCGAELPADAPQGVCPKCMMAMALNPSDLRPSQDPSPTEPPSGGSRFALPRPAELARLFPQLEIVELLGHGGMGAVYKARQKGLDRLVALKILPAEFGRDEAFMNRFSREAKALARLDHPNIVTVHDFGQAGDLCYLVMEYVDGLNLRQLRQAGTLTPKEALALIPQICEALQYAHDAGVVHRDIKPENILVDRRGRVKIADFGLAKLLGGQAEHTLTGSQQAMGTFHYMAPEQLAGAAAVDHRADIYSLGVVFYELLTGNLPVGRFSPPSKKVHIDVRLDEVVLRALESEPDRRYQHASEVKTDVESICGIPAAHMPAQLRHVFGYEFRSQTTLLGWPLVHIATGVNPATMKKRIAKGWIAIGDVAMGGLALGGCAIGVFSFGGCALGAFALGGLSLGLLVAFGGLAIGAFSMGGVSLGVVAIGGLAAGVYAYGGLALGLHALGGGVRDPVAEQFFNTWGKPAFRSFTLLSILTPVLMVVIFGVIFVTAFVQRRREAAGGSIPLGAKPPQAEPARASSGDGRLWGIVLLLAAMFVLCAALAVAIVVWYVRASFQPPQRETPAAAQGISQVQMQIAERQSRLSSHTWWEMTEAGPVLVPEAILAMKLTERQVEQVNAAMRDAFNAYLPLEQQHSQQEVLENGRCATTIEAFPAEAARLEDEFWSRLDAVLDVEQQSIARANLRVRPVEFRQGTYLSHVVAPGLLGYAHHGARIETWRVGSWHHWKVQTRGCALQESAPQAPPLYRRFWPP